MVEWLVGSTVLRLSCHDWSSRRIKATDERISTSTVMVGLAVQLGGVRDDEDVYKSCQSKFITRAIIY